VQVMVAPYGLTWMVTARDPFRSDLIRVSATDFGECSADIAIEELRRIAVVNRNFTGR